MVAPKREEIFVNKFNMKYGECFEYLGGYDANKRKKIIIRCKKCGYIRERSKENIFNYKVNICCPACGNNEKRPSKECVVCGAFFLQYSPQHLMCKACHYKTKRAKKRVQKRLREARATHNGKADYSVTLNKLIERDNYICQLCGGRVDESDYVYKGDAFIAGNNYPSIDHIKPLSKGGVHQWDNVQLAHRICNSIKCDKENDHITPPVGI